MLPPVDRARQIAGCFLRNSGVLVVVVLVFYLISASFDGRIDYTLSVERISVSYLPITLSAIFLIALLESLFPITIYFPGTTLLIGIALLSAKSPFYYLYPAFSTLGTLTGCAITWYWFGALGQRAHKVIHFEVTKLTDWLPRWVGSIVFAFQPSALTSYYALSGFRREPLRFYFLLSCVSTAVFQYSYVFAMSKVPLDFNSIASNHAGYVTIVLLILACAMSLPCFSCKKLGNAGVADRDNDAPK